MAPLPAASLGAATVLPRGLRGICFLPGAGASRCNKPPSLLPFSFSLAGCRRRLQCRDASMHRLTRSLTPSSSGGAQPDYSLHHVFRRHYPLSGFWGGERWQAEAREGEGAVAEPHATSPGSALPGSARAGGGTRARGGCGSPPSWRSRTATAPLPRHGTGGCAGPQHPVPTGTDSSQGTPRAAVRAILAPGSPQPGGSSRVPGRSSARRMPARG